MEPNSRHLPYSLTLILGSIFGLIAAFALTLEKLNQLANPGAVAACDFSLLVQCGSNLGSWQGSLFGFPNPLLGLVGWSMVLVVGVALIGKAVFPDWFLRLLSFGVTLALAFVIWLIYVSVFMLGTLCPWCIVTWLATIPVFISTWTWTTKEGVWGNRFMLAGDRLYFWTPTLVFVGYLAPALIAQLRLDWFGNIFL
jgi:uncharacterized membrane protein